MSNIIKLGNYNLKLANNPRIANIYGLIIYNDANPYIKKVLRDKDFWLSLDQVSGPSFPVFTIKPKEGNFKSERDGKSMDFLVELWNEPRENEELLNELKLDDTSELPMLLIFTSIDNEIVYAGFNIENENTDLTYKSLKNTLNSVKETISKFDFNQYNNAESLFREVTGNLDYIFTWKKVISGLDIIKKFKSYMNIV